MGVFYLRDFPYLAFSVIENIFVQEKVDISSK